MRCTTHRADGHERLRLRKVLLYDHAHRAPPVHVLDNVHASRLEQAREEDLKRCLVRVRVEKGISNEACPRQGSNVLRAGLAGSASLGFEPCVAGSAGLGLEPYMAHDHVVRVVQRVVYYDVEGRRREASKGGGGVECARQARIGRVGLGVG